MPNPLSDPFWQAENKALRAAIAEIAIDIMLAAAENAIAMLPAGAQILADWTLINQDVMAYLNGRYLTDVLPVINGTTRRVLRPIIEDWIRSGEPLAALEKRLVPLFGDVRSAAIAATEVTHIFAAGQLIAFNSSGMVGAKVWRTAMDEFRCPICSALEGVVVELGANFTLNINQVLNSSGMKHLELSPASALKRATSLLSRGNSWMIPPAHVRCRCWIGPLLDESLVRQQIAGALASGFFAEAGRPELLASLMRAGK